MKSFSSFFVLALLLAVASLFASVFTFAQQQQQEPQKQKIIELPPARIRQFLGESILDDPSTDLRLHQCIHDSHVIPRLLKREKAEFDARPEHEKKHHTISLAEEEEEEALEKVGAGSGERKKNERKAKAQSVGPTRFVLRTDSLYDSNLFCSSSSGKAPSLLGDGTYIPCSSDTVLTIEKRDILVKKLLPEVLRRLSNAFHVNQLTSAIKVPATVCKGFVRPAADATAGVDKADFVLLVGGAPIDNSATAGWGSSCGNNVNGRAVVGAINLSPKYLKWYTDDASKNEKMIRAVMHEMIHSMQFSQFGLLSLTSGNVETITIRGKQARVVKTTKAVDEYRKFCGCSTAKPEIEDQSGSIQAGSQLGPKTTGGTSYSHWERRNSMFDGIMVGSSQGMQALDAVTLAFFADTGVWFPNMSAAESLVWGRKSDMTPGKECEFHTQLASPGSVYMSTATQTNFWCDKFAEMKNAVCGRDFRSYGKCSLRRHPSAITPTWFRNFPADSMLGGHEFSLMDYTATVSPFADAHCDNPLQKVTDTERQRGESFAANGRCFMGNLIWNFYKESSQAAPARCVLVRCPGGTKLQFRLSGRDSGWIACPTDGKAGTVSGIKGFDGSIQCPQASKICTDKSLWVANDAPTGLSSSSSPAPGSPPNNSPSSPNSPQQTPSPPETTQLPKQAVVVTALKVSTGAEFNETRYISTLAQMLAPIDSRYIKVERTGDYELLVTFSGGLATMYAQRAFELSLTVVRQYGFISVSAHYGGATPGQNNNNNGGSDKGWLAFTGSMPVYLFFILVGVALLVIIFIIMCCYMKHKKKRQGGEFDPDSSNAHLAKQYQAFDEGAEQELHRSFEKTPPRGGGGGGGEGKVAVNSTSNLAASSSASAAAAAAAAGGGGGGSGEGRVGAKRSAASTSITTKPAAAGTKSISASSPNSSPSLASPATSSPSLAATVPAPSSATATTAKKGPPPPGTKTKINTRFI